MPAQTALPVPAGGHHGSPLAAVQLLVGVMITANVSERHRDDMRSAADAARGCDCGVRLLFFAGAGGNFSAEGTRRGDVVQLDFEEAMNDGKTYRWFAYAHWLAATRHTRTAFTFKMDTDTSVDWCALCSRLRPLRRRHRHVYMGRMNTRDVCGGYSTAAVLCPPRTCAHFDEECWIYMSGGMYGMSTATLAPIMAHPFTRAHARGREDMVTGRWVQHAVRGVHLESVDNGELWCHSSEFHRAYPTVGDVRRAWASCVK